jgi:phosphosulfolactate phosphohydrolase-like enzyme
LLQATYRTDLAFTDTAWMAYHTFAAVRQRLPAALRLGQGGINVIEAGLEDDIDFCARLDAVPLVARISTDLRINRE